MPFCFTNKAKVYNLRVFDLPEAPLRARGKHFANLISLTDDERVVSVLPVKEFTVDTFVMSVTQQGYIKKTDLMAFSNVKASGIIGLKLEDKDSLVTCSLVQAGEDVLIATKLGKAIRFNQDDVRPMGRVSRGVTGIRFSEEGDEVVGLQVVPRDDNKEITILSVCRNGYGKRTPLEEYRKQTRGGKGTYTIKVTERNGPVVGICSVTDTDHLMIMTSTGKLMRFTVSEIGVIGRLTQGVRLISVGEGEVVNSLSKVVKMVEDEVETDSIVGTIDED